MGISLLSLLLTVGLVGIAVVIHYEALILLNRRFNSYSSHRLALLATTVGLLFTHTLQIWFFAVGYWACVHWLRLGDITPPIETLRDAVYFSAMVYTTVGFGDLIPTGPLRMLVSGEALLGFALITWSASFTFLQMQKLWGED